MKSCGKSLLFKLNFIDFYHCIILLAYINVFYYCFMYCILYSFTYKHDHQAKLIFLTSIVCKLLVSYI